MASSMGSPNQGPEDSLAWKNANLKETNVVSECVQCKIDIVSWHCGEAGCPWCYACGLIMEGKK